eukprot:212566-Rhodomonas_salina.1
MHSARALSRSPAAALSQPPCMTVCSTVSSCHVCWLRHRRARLAKPEANFVDLHPFILGAAPAVKVEILAGSAVVSSQ